MAARTIPWSHVVSPNGWAVVRPGEVVYLTPAIPLPQWRAMDMRLHRKTLSTAIVSVRYAQQQLPRQKGFILHNPVLRRTYYIVMEPASESLAPLSYMAHSLTVYCETGGARSACDLSLLYALASPMAMPDYAALIFRAMAVAAGQGGYAAPQREATWVIWYPKTDSEMSEPDWLAKTRKPLDCLADPECHAALVRLIHDLSENSRCIGWRLGLWRPPPTSKCPGVEATPEDIIKRFEEGGFTEIAKYALLFIGHWYPVHQFLKYF